MDTAVLQLFVSVPETRPFYKRDVLNLCCFPAGERLALAFKRKWVANSVLEEAESVLAKHAKPAWEAVIIYCEELSKVDGDDIYRFHPIRLARVVDVQVGSAATFVVELGDFFVYEDDAPDAHGELLRQSAEHPNYQRLDSRRPHQNAKFVRWVSETLTLKTHVDAWDGLLEHFSSLRGISDSWFFAAADPSGVLRPKRIAKSRTSFISRLARTSVISWLARTSVVSWIADTITAPWKGATTTNDSSATSALVRRIETKVRRGKEVELDLYAVSGSTALFDPPLAEIPDEIAHVSGPFMRQYSRGYLIHYHLLFKSGWANESAMLKLAVPFGRGGGSPCYRSPEFAVHVRVTTRLWLIVMVFFLLFLGSLLSALDGDTLKTFLGLDAAQAKNWSIVATVLGPVLVSIGAVIGFKTLPGE